MKEIHDLLDDAADALGDSPGHEDLVRDLRSNATSMRQAWETFLVDAAADTAFDGAPRAAIRPEEVEDPHPGEDATP